MAKGHFRTKGPPNWAHVEYEPGWTALPITEDVYRHRGYEPLFDELPWRGTGESLPRGYAPTAEAKSKELAA
jgi:hypothetical protein